MNTPAVKPDSAGTGDAGTLRPAVVGAFGMTVAMCCAAYVTHLPGLGLPSAVAGPVVLAAQGLAGVILGRFVARSGAARIGAAAGLGAGLLGLLVVMSVFGDRETPTVELPANAPLLGAGYVLLSVVLGLVGAVIGAAIARKPVAQHRGAWLARMGVVSCLAFVPLLISGGLVTSFDAGLAVPDWPRTYGANMFLYPISLMADPRIFLEHAHRLLGALVGLTTLAQLVFVLVSGVGGKARTWAILVFALVCVQGLAGGLRVTEDSAALRVVHGVLSQIIFAMNVALAAFLSPTYRGIQPSTPDPRDRRRKSLAAAMLHTTLVQLALGATYRHLGQMHALWTHAAFSLAVMVFALLVGFSLAGRAPGTDAVSRLLPRLGKGLVGVVIAQFLLGWTAFFAVLHSNKAVEAAAGELASPSAAETVGAVVRSLHQANGAFVLALATLALVWVKRALRPPR